MISGMAYGAALTEDIKISLAKGSALAGTAYNTGESGMLPRERLAAEKLILQYSRGHWEKDPKTLQRADAIELQFGQGAIRGTFHALAPKEITKELRKQFEVKKGQSSIAQARIPGIEEEMEIALRAMEKTSIHQLSKNDLVSIDSYVEKITGVRAAHLTRS